MILAEDFTGVSCEPSKNVWEDTSSNQYFCRWNNKDYNSGVSTEQACNAGQMSWFGQTCEACPASKNTYQCEASYRQNHITCDPSYMMDGGACA